MKIQISISGASSIRCQQCENTSKPTLVRHSLSPWLHLQKIELWREESREIPLTNYFSNIQMLWRLCRRFLSTWLVGEGNLVELVPNFHESHTKKIITISLCIRSWEFTIMKMWTSIRERKLFLNGFPFRDFCLNFFSCLVSTYFFFYMLFLCLLGTS